MTERTTDKSVAQFLTQRIEACGKTQRQIANEVGYVNANVITMFKQGQTKVPIHMAPKLAVAIDVDPATFLRLVVNEYMPDLISEIETHLGGLCTLNELGLLNVIRGATKSKDPALTKSAEKSLAAWAKEHLG